MRYAIVTETWPPEVNGVAATGFHPPRFDAYMRDNGAAFLAPSMARGGACRQSPGSLYRGALTGPGSRQRGTSRSGA